MSKAKQEEESHIKCFNCGSKLTPQDSAVRLFSDRIQADGEVRCCIGILLSTVLAQQLEEDEPNSKLICDSCNKRLEKYEKLEECLAELKFDIISDFNKAQTYEENFSVESYKETDTDKVRFEDVHATVHNAEDHSGTHQAAEELMSILCTSGMEGQLSIQNENGKAHIKLEPYQEVAEEEEYFDQNAEHMVEIIAENDDTYADIIEEHHPNLSNDGSTFIEVIDGEKSLAADDAIVIKVENPTSRDGYLVENPTSRDSYLVLDNGDTSSYTENKTSNSSPSNQILYTHNGQVFLCNICMEKDSKPPEDFDSKTISTHLKLVHNIRVYICDLCGQDFVKRTKLTEHIDEEHGGTEDGEFQCETCDRVFTNLRLFRVHKRLHYAPAKSFSCNQCDKKYSSKNLLDEHMNMHTGNRPYKCPDCPKDFASKYTLRAHQKIHSDRERPYNCKQCPKAFFSLQNLQQHERTHSGEKNFICPVCEKAFGTQHNLEVHKIVHTGYKPFICRTCNKAFARRAEIKDHERTHTGEKPFACDICNMSFAQRSNLTTHKRATHLNDKRYKCEQCDRSFKRRRLLDYHIRASHTGERPYKCNLCNATFVYPEHFKKHTRIHTGLKPFACEICGKTFNSRDNRNAHRFIHSDKKPYECGVCGRGFMRKPLVQTHMQETGHQGEIIVNRPNVKQLGNVSESNSTMDENIIEDCEMVEEHLIIDGPVQFGADEDDQVGEETAEENSMPSEILEEDYSEVIDSEQVFITDGGHYIKAEDGTLFQIKPHDADGKGYTWFNIVSEQ